MSRHVRVRVRVLLAPRPWWLSGRQDFGFGRREKGFSSRFGNKRDLGRSVPVGFLRLLLGSHWVLELL